MPQDDAALALVADREAVLFVRATTSEPSEAVPPGRVMVTDAQGRTLADLALVAPHSGLQAEAPLAVDFPSHYWAVLPASAVRTGMQVEVSLADRAVVHRAAPRVLPSVPIELVLVPLRVGSDVGRAYANAAELVQDRVPATAVTASQHAAFALADTRPADKEGWDALMNEGLSQLAHLRAIEGGGPHRHYVGFLPVSSRNLLAAGRGALPGFVSVMTDVSDQPLAEPRVLVHELGHNFGLRHAPCNDPPGVDAEFPYANAALGAQNRFIDGFLEGPGSFIAAHDPHLHDVMSYCNGHTFSDYNFSKLQHHLAAASGTGDLELGTPGDSIAVAGTILGGQVRLRPVYRLGRELPDEVSAGSTYRLVLDTTSGTVERGFDAQAVGDGDGELFALRLRVPGSPRRLQVWRGNTLLLEQTAPAVIAAGLPAPVPTTLDEASGRTRLRWDASRHPNATVVHVRADGQRAVLALGLGGGSAEVSTRELPPGGRFEVLLSGLDGTSTVFPR